MAKFYYGGQAVIEGVMMRGQRNMAVAVRAPDGAIVVHEEQLSGAIYRHPAMRYPFLRGLVGLWDALGLGMRALAFSANVAAGEGTGAEPEGRKLQGSEATTPFPVPQLPTSMIEASTGQTSSQFGGAAVWGSVAIALIMMVGIFFVLPVLAAGVITGLTHTQSSFAVNVIEGVIRLSLFVLYIWAIGRMKDIQRVFGYHGAEHKTINAYEAGCELMPEKVQSFTLLNPRCGTTFLLIVLLFATVVFVLIGKLSLPLLILSRILLVPVIASIAFEFIRLMANHYDNSLVRAIMAPGLALQKLTTRPPDLEMLEVGIAALNSVLTADKLLDLKSRSVEGEAALEQEPAATIA